MIVRSRLKYVYILFILTAAACAVILLGTRYSSHHYIERTKDIIQILNNEAVHFMDPSPSRIKRFDLILRSAFIDKRPRDNHYNATVIFAEASKEVRRYQLIVGCGTGEYTAKVHTVKSLHWLYIDFTYPQLTHENIIIICYDMPAQRNASTAFVYYNERLSSTAPSKRSVAVSVTHSMPGQTDAVVVCVTCFGRPPWLSQWLRYQKAIGVDLVQMYVEDTFMENSQNHNEIRKYVEEGFLKLEFRKTYFNSSQVFYLSQALNYNDCLYRNQKFSFMMFADTDDFFVPRIKNENRLGNYVKKFLKDNYAAVQFKWLSFFPDCGFTQPPESVKDGNLTAILRVQEHRATHNYKMVCQPSLTTQVTIHKPRYFLNKNSEVYVVESTTQAYVAHIRSNHQDIIDFRCPE